MKNLLMLVFFALMTILAIAAQQPKSYVVVISPKLATDVRGETVYDVREQDTQLPVVAGKLSPPEALSTPKVSIPFTSRMHYRKVAITVEGVVTATGDIVDASIADQGDDAALAQNVLKAFQRWKFRPGMLDGKPVAVFIQQTSQYNIF